VLVYRQGEMLYSIETEEAGETLEWTFTDSPATATWYRIEMHARQSPDSEMLLFSSPIYTK